MPNAQQDEIGVMGIENAGGSTRKGLVHSYREGGPGPRGLEGSLKEACPPSVALGPRGKLVLVAAARLGRTVKLLQRAVGAAKCS